jgi:poly(glycerol-phosphate) alpha-glucosyltransferase
LPREHSSRDAGGSGSVVKVGFIVPWAGVAGGGLFTAVAGLAGALHALGVEVELFVPRGDARVDERDTCSSVVPIQVVGPSRFCFQPALAAVLQAAKPDVIHLHGLWTYQSVAALRWGRTTGRPRVVSPHGMLDPWALRQSRVRKCVALALFERAALREAQCVHAVSTAEADAVRRGKFARVTCVVPNGVDVPNPISLTIDDRPQELPAGRILLYLGRFHAKKGLYELLEGWVKSGPGPAEGAPWNLVLAGFGEPGDEAKLRTMVSTIKGSRVTILGPRTGTAKRQLFAVADGFILPSHSEGLPVAVLEAWAQGVPVLMSKECNLPEGFQVGAALAVTPDAAAIAMGIDQFRRMSPEERAAMGEAGRRLVEERFSWQVVGHQMLQTYEWLLGREARPMFVQAG